MGTLRKLKPEEYSEVRKEAMLELESTNKVSETEIVKVDKPIKKGIIKTEPDKKLIADIVKLYAKYNERTRIETIMYYWELGKRVNKEYGKPRAESLDSTRNSSKKGFIKLKDSYTSLVRKLRELDLLIVENIQVYLQLLFALV